MKNSTDEWGHDPSIQSARRVFSMMEAAQQKVLRQLDMAEFDNRLRYARETALAGHGKACNIAAAKRRYLDETAYSEIYVCCFLGALAKQGVYIPDTVWEAHKEYADWVREVLT
jgi:hypothetical protein